MRHPQGSLGRPCTSSACGCSSQWVTVATGANYPAFPLVGPVLRELVTRHLQFQVGWRVSEVPQPRVASAAAAVLAGVARRRAKMPGDTLYVGVHVR